MTQKERAIIKGIVKECIEEYFSEEKKAKAEKVYRISEACSYLGLTKGSLYDLTKKKKISFRKPGGKLIYFTQSDLDSYLLQNKSIAA